MRNGQLTFGKRSSSRPASLTITDISHEYALLSQQPVASNFPSVENDTQSTGCACWRGEPMGWPFSMFHNRAVWSQDALARIRPFGDIAMPWTALVCPVKTVICCQVAVLHILIKGSYDPGPEISVFPSGVQARQYTPENSCPLRFVTSSPVFASQILR